MRKDGTITYLAVEHYHPGGGGVPEGWGGPGEGFWMPEYHQGRKLPYTNVAPQWRARERMADGSYGWKLEHAAEAEQAFNDCRTIFHERKWRLVRVTVTQTREEIVLATIDC